MPLGTLGKYERLDVLGHGVSGIVYLARDTLLHRQVALKEVDVQAGDARRFLEEARVLDRLRHPNIVQVNSVDRIDGKILIDMEYVRGQNLQNLLRAEGPLALYRSLDITAQVLDGLDYAHRMQTVHRDIKPANILVSREGQVKLADFGLAEILATNAYAGGAGTYAYMAPEDFAEEDRSDHLSDLWAVGVTLYEMLTLQRPFTVTRMKDPFAWKRAVENDLPAPLTEYLPDAPPALQTVLDRALSREKRERYPSAGEFREDLLRVQAGQPVAPETLRAGERMARRRREREGGTDALPDGSTRVLPPPLPTAARNGEGESVSPRLRSERNGPGVVVADVNTPFDLGPAPPQAAVRERGREPQPDLRRQADGQAIEPAEAMDTVAARRRMRLPFARREVEPRLLAEPEAVDFGVVRKGELRSVKVQVRTQGIEGRVNGRVLHNPGWLTVHPMAFDRTKQTILLTAHTARAWETGEFHETVRIESEAGNVEIPVRLMVMKPRPTFRQVAAWYLPLFAATVLPLVTLAFGSSGIVAGTTSLLVPTAAVTSGLLAVMLLLVCVAVETGLNEKIACGVLMAAMCFVLGVTVAQMRLQATQLNYALVTGGLVGGVLLLQLLYLRRWKLWAFALFGLSLLVSGTFLRFLSG